MRSSTCWFQRAFPELIRCESNLSPGRLTVSTLGVRVFCPRLHSPVSCLLSIRRDKASPSGLCDDFPILGDHCPSQYRRNRPALHTASGEGSAPGFGYYILVLEDVFFRHVDKHISPHQIQGAPLDYFRS